MTRLPAAGRQGETPAWPLSKGTKAELSLWERLWRTPQAVAWERLGWSEVVASYARIFVRAVSRTPDRADMSERRQLEDRLGLNPMSMLRLRWEIADDANETTAEEDPSVVLHIEDRIPAVE